MKRRPCDPLTLLSLLLCVAVCVLWARSYRVADAVSWWQGSWHHGALSASGQISLRQVRWDDGSPFRGEPHDGVRYGRIAPEPASQTDFGYARLAGLRRHWHGLGFRWMISDGGSGVLPRGLPFTSVPTRDVAISHWLPALLSSLLPARWLARRLLRRRRARAGLCPRCGYDLRETRDRCPECGSIQAPKAAREEQPTVRRSQTPA
jgi:hypothetical protein